MLARALDLLFPPQCLHCDTLVPTHGTLCLPCWQGIAFIADPFCRCCGHPFDFTMGEEALCANCMREMPPYVHARAVMRYNDASRSLVLKLKYQDQLYLAQIYGTWLAKAGRELIGNCDLIVPVPLYYWRFVSRRYNQSALLGEALARHCALPVIPDALTRLRATQSQSGLTFAQRRDNVKGAFSVNEKHAASLKGKTVLLIDDVMTTGETLSECAHALLAAGAMRVHVLTLARTVN
jgi:ComF family protein